MKAENAWHAALGQLEIEMPKAAYNTWVRDAELLSYEDGCFFIGVHNAYARDWLESRLSSKICTLLSQMMDRTIEVRFSVWQNNGSLHHSTREEDNQPGGMDSRVDEISETQVSSFHEAFQQAAVPSRPPTGIKLNPKYTFESFVVGPSNRLAHAASMSVADKPAQAYNPLFLYGGVGLGKTHLLHAIGNLCQVRGQNVLYVSSEEFTNDLIHSIRTQTTGAFRERYRNTDVLLIDDIQFIAGKESTQEEFFHTFNSLHGHNKQIVITSDRPPKAMNTLEERLRSRFEWGLTADIQHPDYETRLAIVRAKADRAGYRIPEGIAEMIARKIQTNIREIEGALTRIVAFSDLSGLPLTPQLVDSALADLLPRRNEVQPNQILRAVAETFGLTVERLLGRDRSREVAVPRQIAMYLLREESNYSLPQIGETLGGRDHTTIMYGCDKAAEMIETDDQIRRQVVEIRQSLYGASGIPMRGTAR